MRKVYGWVLLFLGIVAAVPLAAAQDAVTVPDVTGLTVPVAAATLNRAGIGIGQEISAQWTAESGFPQNSVGAQSVAAGTSVDAGTKIDLTVLRSPNMLLIYDDNDFTLINQTGGSIDLSGISLRALDGSGASFAASRWGATLREDRCAQVWSVNRNGPKGLDECDYIEHWLSTTNGGEHFWTGAGGATRFAVLQNGIERVQCPVANPGHCEFYLPAGSAAGDATEHVYFAYTQDRLAVINNTTDKWMPLQGLRVLNNFAPTKGAPVTFADATLYGRNLDPVANINQLAPGQCILFTNSSPTAETPPQPCDVVARLDVGPSVIFWGAAFDVESITDDQPHSCPVATADRLTLCIMPR
ncbi:MAG: PASTA domain-containing protein [Anaerolineae bacterium]|nr:PASTA domain-containing protein [Anaerolineae bacterium]